MRSLIASMEAEYNRYRALAESAMIQLSEAELSKPGPGGGNSVAVVAWHLAGNLASRFTDFLTTDGEKPWRNRDQEFLTRTRDRQNLMDHWNLGWEILIGSLATLNDDHLQRKVIIRRTELSVQDALLRSLAHVSYHVGQIVYAAKGLRGENWEYLSIPPGDSEAYSRNPTSEHADAHTAKLKNRHAPPPRTRP